MLLQSEPKLSLTDIAVTYASGRSSMEVTCKVAKAPAEGQKSSADDILMSCQFTMVALDPHTRK